MRYFYYALRACNKIRQGFDVNAKTLSRAFGEVSARYYHDFWTAAAAAAGADIEHISDCLYRICKGDEWIFVDRHRMSLDSYLSREIVDNKPLIHQFLGEQDWEIPPYLTYDLRNLRAARRFMEGLGSRVVVKPIRSSGGRGVTTNIGSYRELVRASLWASGFDSSLMLEQHVEGDCYRLLFLNGELIATVRREPPVVVGDGICNIRHLVRLENQNRIHGAPATSLMPLTIDLDCKLALRRQNLSLRSIPAKDEKVQIKSAINENASGGNHTVSGKIHPSFHELGRRIASDLNLTLFGVDLITQDIGFPLRANAGVLNEINIPPGLHYHDLVSEKSTRVPVGEVILSSIFDKRSERMLVVGLD